MPEYQVEVKQLVDYPRCRIYRPFIQSLIADRSLHSNGGCGLFYFNAFRQLSTKSETENHPLCGRETKGYTKKPPNEYNKGVQAYCTKKGY